MVIILMVVSILVIAGLLIQLLSINGSLGKFMQFTVGHNYKYSAEVDDKINDLLDNHAPISISRSSINFEEDYSIWIENKYYGYGQLYTGKGRCSWKTAKRIMKLEEELRSGL